MKTNVNKKSPRANDRKGKGAPAVAIPLLSRTAEGPPEDRWGCLSYMSITPAMGGWMLDAVQRYEGRDSA